MKQKLLLKVMLLLCALVAGSSSVWADTGTLVSALNGISSGDTYYIAALNSSKYYTVPNTTISGQTFTCAEGSSSGSTLTPASGAGEFVFTSAGSDNAYYIYNTNLKKYLVATGSKTFGYVESSSSDYGYWTFTTVGTGDFAGFSGVFSVQHSSKTHYMRAYNNTVKCYDGASNSGIYLFKKDPSNKVTTPSINGDTPFITSTEVSISCATTGATIQYSLDNGSNWTNYSDPFTLTETKTVKAKATKSGMTDSDEASATFTKVTPMTVAEALEAIDALADNGTIDNQYVTGIISQVDEYNSSYKSITYWISADGTTTSQLEVYSGKGLKGANFSAVTDLTVGDIVVVNGTLKKYVKDATTTPEFNSNSQLISLIDKVKVPTFSPAAGAVAANTEVTISTTTEGATIYYTTDGTNPTTSSSIYSAPVSIDAAKTIKAFAVKDGHPDSDIATAAYTIAEPCATPTFSLGAGEVEKGATVTISTTTDGATIYYTTDGTTPTTSSTAYSSAITINSAMTLKAVAVKDGMANSEVATAAYTVRDYVILPFNWAGGGKSTLTNLSGVTANGLGTDYGNTHDPYNVKFDDSNDYILIKTNARPGRVTVGVKMIGGATTSTITVQGSADGSSFNNVEALTISGSTTTTLTLNTTKAFAATDRYVKLLFTKGSNVGVGPISIAEYSDVSKTIYSTYTTMTSDYALDFTNVYGMTAYIVKDNDTSDGYVTLTQVNKVPANTGLILKVNSTGYPYSIPVLIGDAGDVSGNKMAGSATEDTEIAANGGYILKNGAFHPANAGNLPAGKAYLNIAASTGAPVLNLDFGDEITGINDVRGKTADVRDGIYDLQGRKVAQPTKGLYIVKGKKVIIK